MIALEESKTTLIITVAVVEVANAGFERGQWANTRKHPAAPHQPRNLRHVTMVSHRFVGVRIYHSYRRENETLLSIFLLTVYRTSTRNPFGEMQKPDIVFLYMYFYIAFVFLFSRITK